MNKTDKTLYYLWDSGFYDYFNKILDKKLNTKITLKLISPYLNNNILFTFYKEEKRIENEYVSLLIDLDKELKLNNVVLTIKKHHDFIYLNYKTLKQLITLLVCELKKLDIEGYKKSVKKLANLLEKKEKIKTVFGTYKLNKEPMLDNERNYILIAKDDKDRIIKLRASAIINLKTDDSNVLEIK